MTRFSAICILAAFVMAVEAASRVERAASCPRMFDSFNGQVKYRRKGKRVTFKCSNKMRLHGTQRLNCQRDGTWSGEQPVCISSGCVPFDTSSQPRLNTKDKYSDGSYMQFSCTGNYYLVGAKEAFCNGFEFSAPLPSCVAPEDLMDCDFENGLCGWTQDTTDDHDWMKNVGPTPTAGTGPMFDHTFMQHQNGHYLYFESSSPVRANDVARLLSPEYSPKFSPMCFDFWYHMNGPPEEGHVGRLEAYIKGVDEDLDDLQPVFVKEGNQGENWHKADFFIDTRADSYQIVIVGTKLLSYLSDIAIDDLMLYNCTSLTSTTSLSTTISTPSTSETPETPETRASRKPTKPTKKPPVTRAPKPTTPVVTKAPKTSTPAATKAPTTTATARPATPIVTKPTTHIVTKAPTTTVNMSTTSRPEFPKINTTIATEEPRTNGTTATRKPNPTPAITKEITSSPQNTTAAQMQTNATKVKEVTPKSTNINLSSTTSSVTSLITSSKKNNTSLYITTMRQSPTKKTPVTPQNKTTTPKQAISTGKTPLVTSTAYNPVNVTDKPKPSTTKKLNTTKAQIKTTSITITTRLTTTVATTPKTTKTSTLATQTSTRKSTTKATMLSQTSEEPESTIQVHTSKTTTKAPLPTRSTRKPTQAPTTPATTLTAQLTTTQSPFANSSVVTPKQQTTAKFTTTVRPTTVKSTRQSVSSTPAFTKKTSTNDSVSNSSPDAIGNDTRVAATHERTEHPQDETLKPLMIGLVVGILVGLMIIGVIAWVCVRRRKFYTSRFEDELKPITNSASLQSLNNGQFYVEEYHDLEDQESES